MSPPTRDLVALLDSAAPGLPELAPQPWPETPSRPSAPGNCESCENRKRAAIADPNGRTVPDPWPDPDPDPDGMFTATYALPLPEPSPSIGRMGWVRPGR
jgi:hypothetical protein